MTLTSPAVTAARSHAALRSLATRHALGFAANFIGSVILARALGPRDWGAYGVALVVMAVTQQAVERGSVGYVIQRTRPLDRDELAGLFTIQALVALTMCVLLSLCARLVAEIAREQVLALFLSASGVASALYALRAVPLGVLERSLRYERVAVVEVTDILVFNTVSVAGVLAGWGLGAVLVGLVARAAVSLVISIALARVTFRLAFRRRVVSEFTRLGVPYAASNGLTFVNTAAAPVILGGSAGLSEYGLLQLAYTLAVYPQTATAIVSRVSFATYARAERRELAAQVSRSTATLLRLAGGSTILVAATSLLWVEPLFGTAWSGTSKYIIAIAPAYGLGASLSLIISAISVVGGAGRVFIVAAVFSASYWVGAVLMVMHIGGLALPLAYSFATATYCAYLVLAKSLIGTLTIRPALLEYFMQCVFLLGFVSAEIAGVPRIALIIASMISLAWIVRQVDVSSLYKIISAPLRE